MNTQKFLLLLLCIVLSIWQVFSKRGGSSGRSGGSSGTTKPHYQGTDND